VYGYGTTDEHGALLTAVLDATNTFHVWPGDRAGNIGAAASDAVLVLNPSGDFDGDGMSNADEETAGTGADEGTSRFTVDALETPVGSGTFTITWFAATGRAYSLLYADELTNGTAWAGVDDWTNVAGQGALVTYTGTVTGLDQRFYRVNVRRAE